MLAVSANPVISVVIPLPDDRGQLVDCLHGFTSQTLTEPSEVIVATADTSADDLTQLVEQFPGVRSIVRPGLRVGALYNAGAEVAVGHYLYISESHCVPHPDCLRQVLDFVRQTGYQASCSNSDGINGNYVAAGEQRIFEEDFRQWMEEGKCKISIRGTLIERELWNQVGGLQAEFGHFAEVMFGLALEVMGVRMGFAARSIVSHCNQVSFKLLAQELFEYGEDQCRASHMGPAEQQGVPSAEWAGRERLLRYDVLLKLKQKKETLRQRLREMAIRYVPMPDELRFRLFRKFWQGAARLGRLNYLAKFRRQGLSLAESPGETVPVRQAA